MVETFAGAQTILVFFPRYLLLFHRMSEDLGFGDESPVLDHLNEAEHVAPKRKGGRTKETNNARGIPESIQIELGYDTPPEETKDQCKIHLQNIRRYWAIRWYIYKSILDWKWAMQFAFSPPFLYTSHMCGKYTEENRHLYYPVPPKYPHPNTLKTPHDYPEEQERLRIAAEKKRLKEAKKAAKLAALKLMERSRAQRRRGSSRRNLLHPLMPPPMTKSKQD